jgi:hypothetical protein
MTRPSQESSRRPDPFDRPLDALLERLRIHQLSHRPHPDDLERWIATCPCCGNEMVLREPYIGAAVTVICGHGCHETRIIAALAADPLIPGSQGLDLAEDASAIAQRALELLEASCR